MRIFSQFKWLLLFIELVLLIYVSVKSEDVGIMLYFWLEVFLLQTVFWMVLNNIIKNGINYRDKTIIVWWLCCLRLGDPYEKPPQRKRHKLQPAAEEEV